MNAAGTRILRYHIEITHKALDLHKELSAPEIEILQNKINVLIANWDKRYEAYLTRKARSDGKKRAAELTQEADTRRVQLQAILAHTLKIDDAVDWNVLKSSERFDLQEFRKAAPQEPSRISLPKPPEITFFDKLFGKAAKKLAEHKGDVEKAEKQQQKQSQHFARKLEKWREEKHQWDTTQLQQKADFDQKQAATNAEVDKLRRAWLEGNSEAIVEHASIVLEASTYPELISKSFDLQYVPEGKTLLVDYALPVPDDLPRTKTMRFVASTGDYKQTLISQKEARELYDTVCYQVCLRTVHEIFEADVPEHIESVVFNGHTDAIDKSTGKNVHAVIMSLMVSREEFLALNLDLVDPKACFKALKGVSAASLSGLAAVAPVMQIDKSDRRFVEARSVELGDDGSTNLAAMDWEEFEHLVRELFEKEFSSRGGEVKVTQASSDGGVDAIAFDPDPISGGKIVIQAKRYTKTVGVSAVRDLYGTVMSEGASKGILVTTADYGPDAHKFAVGKPITLLNGGNLLHLLEKHGISAVIDIAAARKLMGLANA